MAIITVNWLPEGQLRFPRKFNRDQAVKDLGLDPAYPTISYAPTWRDDKLTAGLSKFGREVISQLPASKNLIVKLHPDTKRYDRKNYRMVKAFRRKSTD